MEQQTLPLAETRAAAVESEVRMMQWIPHPDNPMGPPSMKNHTATLFRNLIIVFGGFDGWTNHSRIQTMNVDTKEWRVRDNVDGVAPAGRNGHTATLANNKIFYIGGWLGSGPLGSEDVHTLDPITWTWTRVTTTGAKPGPCNMHTADYIELGPNDKYIFLFRGGDGQSYLNDLHMLDVDKLVWKRPQPKGTPPAPRANHSSAVIGKQLVIFGGWDGQARLHDMHILDAVRMVWTCPETHGIPPTPRAGSTLTCVGDGLILFGGSGPHSSCFNDVHFFDPKTMTWYKAEKDHGSGQRHSIVPKRARVSDSRLARMEDDNPNLQQQNNSTVGKFRIQGDFPEKRAGHSATLVGNRRLLIVGGSFQAEYLKTVYELDIDPPPDLALTTAPPSDALIRGLGVFFNSEEFSDVVFKVEDESIYCHRIILCTQSEWFRVLFQRGFYEAKEREIVINNVPAKVFKQMIEFFYRGTTPLFIQSDSAIHIGDVFKRSPVEIEQSMLDYSATSSSSAPQDGEQDVRSPPSPFLGSSSVASSGGNNTALSVSSSAAASATVFSSADDESKMNALCDLLIVADQFMCAHLKERCEIALAKMVNVRTVKLLLPFAKANRTDKLLRCCEHFERWEGHSISGNMQ